MGEMGVSSGLRTGVSLSVAAEEDILGAWWAFDYVRAVLPSSSNEECSLR